MIDFTPLIDQVLFPFLATLLTAFASWAIAQIIRLAKVKVDQSLAVALETAMQNGINFALSRAQAYADANGKVQVKSQVISDAASYVLPKVPHTLKKLGVSPQGLAERIEARLFGVPTPVPVVGAA